MLVAVVVFFFLFFFHLKSFCEWICGVNTRHPPVLSVVELRLETKWLVDVEQWQWGSEGLDSCCWPDTVVLGYSWSSSIHSLTPEARLVCCRGLRLLLSTMSEHMQLSLALCRIGLYTVRNMHTCCYVFAGGQQGCGVVWVWTGWKAV